MKVQQVSFGSESGDAADDYSLPDPVCRASHDSQHYRQTEDVHPSHALLLFDVVDIQDATGEFTEANASALSLPLRFIRWWLAHPLCIQGGAFGLHNRLLMLDRDDCCLASLVASCYTSSGWHTITSYVQGNMVVPENAAEVELGRQDFGGYGLTYGNAIYAGQAIGLSSVKLSRNKAIDVIEFSGLIPNARAFAGSQLVGIPRRVLTRHISVPRRPRFTALSTDRRCQPRSCSVPFRRRQRPRHDARVHSVERDRRLVSQLDPPPCAAA